MGRMKWPATYTQYFALGMQLPPALQSCFLSIWSAVRLEKVKLKAIQQVEILENIAKMDCQLATYRHKIAQVFQLTWQRGRLPFFVEMV